MEAATIDHGTSQAPDLLAALCPGSATCPRSDRALVVVAHPDDETIGIGGQLPYLPGIRLVHVTDGAPRDGRDTAACGFLSWSDYAQARRSELRNAMQLAGVQPAAFSSLEVPDQQAARRLPALTHGLATLFLEQATQLVFTHPYEGGHPDHDATCFVVHAARGLLRKAGHPGPLIAEMAYYHAGPDGPVRQHFPPGSDQPEAAIELGEADWLRKQSMLACHTTQSRTLAPFTSRTERFRLAPSYDFRALPNGGRLHYDGFAWGLTGAEWLPLARSALDELGLGPVL